jgi:hypothetical protein
MKARSVFRHGDAALTTPNHRAVSSTSASAVDPKTTQPPLKGKQMSTLVVGSKEAEFASEQTQSSLRGFGQNGYGGASSEPIGKARKISKTYSRLASEVNVSATAGEGFQTRTVSAAPIKTTPGMKNPNASPARVPISTVRRANKGLIRPTRA